MNSIDREMSGDLKTGFKCIGILFHLFTLYWIMYLTLKHKTIGTPKIDSILKIYFDVSIKL